MKDWKDLEDGNIHTDDDGNIIIRNYSHEWQFEKYEDMNPREGAESMAMIPKKEIPKLIQFLKDNKLID